MIRVAASSIKLQIEAPVKGSPPERNRTRYRMVSDFGPLLASANRRRCLSVNASVFGSLVTLAELTSYQNRQKLSLYEH